MGALRDIEVEYKLHADVRSLEDEWYGISDPVARRKLQNRLNQRARRRRRIIEKQAKENQAPLVAPQPAFYGVENLRPAALGVQYITDDHFLNGESNAEDKWLATLQVAAQRDPFCKDAETLSRYQPALSRRVIGPNVDPSKLATFDHVDTKAMYQLPADHLLSLVYYNVYRAFVANMTLLGLDIETMCSESSNSPFNRMNLDDPLLASLPPTLRPTRLQRTIPHHCMWDIFPDAVLRDNVLVYGEDNFDDGELCLQLMGDGNVITLDNEVQGRTGLIVWGESWDLASWEVTESFARAWPWFLKGAVDLLASTNKWRATRDEPPIVFEMCD